MPLPDKWEKAGCHVMVARFPLNGFSANCYRFYKSVRTIYDQIDKFVEAADWVIWQLTGVETRNTCTAGYKAMVQDGDFPSSDYFKALDPAFENVVDEKIGRVFAELGEKAGQLTPQMAQMMGLTTDTAVAVANVDAHVTAPAVKATEAGVMVMVMGTSKLPYLVGQRIKSGGRHVRRGQGWNYSRFVRL